MAATIRRGLPRVKGGEPWPPATPVEQAAEAGQPVEVAAFEPTEAPEAASGVPDAVGAASDAVGTASDAMGVAPDAVHAAGGGAGPYAPGPARSSLRRGLPRVKGGEPWPPASAAAAAAETIPSAGTSSVAALPAAATSAEPVAAASGTDDSTRSTRDERAQPAARDALTAQPRTVAAAEVGAGVRRGLPRVAGGEAWPPAGTVPVVTGTASEAATMGAARPDEIRHSAPDAAVASADAADAQTAYSQAAASQTAAGAPGGLAVAVRSAVSTPLPYPRTVWQGRAPRHAGAPLPEPSLLRPSWPRAIGGLLGLASLGLVAVAAVFLVRAFLSTPFMQDFLAMYPGEYHPAVEVEPGFAPWANWAHFFNMFLMVLIIRSGLRVRSEKRPTVFWTPRGNSKGKISLTLWFHQALDLLWIINGVVFVVLLVTTGHWARIVPTSWEVFPNALSAGLQYVSFDWPTDNGWVNYNSLQQLAYFATVFIAAPLAIVTGFRMSGLWPKNAEKLSKAYPVEWARALHFPVMLYFVAFIIVHVALVFLTGALRNLNHMFAAQGSVDGAAYAANWTGFWVFVLAMAVIAGGWFAARPLVLAPIARLFGQVSGR